MIGGVDNAVLEKLDEYLMKNISTEGDIYIHKPDKITMEEYVGYSAEEIESLTSLSPIYIAYCLTSCTPAAPIPKLLDYISGIISTTMDGYKLSLIANALMYAQRTSEAIPALHKLAKLQNELEGYVFGSTTSFCFSYGMELNIETTALALLGWLHEPHIFQKQIKGAAEYLGSKPLRHMSTQGISLTLEALTKFEGLKPKLGEGEELVVGVEVEVNGVMEHNKDIHIIGGQISGDVDIYKIHQELSRISSKDNVEIHIKTAESENIYEIPYSLSLNYLSSAPCKSPPTNLTLSLSYDQTTLPLHSPIQIHITVHNPSPRNLGMVVSLLRLPAGICVSEQNLEEVGKRGGFDYYQVREGGDIEIYFKCFPAAGQREVKVFGVGVCLGVFLGGASSVYEYYNPDNRSWVISHGVTVVN